ncbi:MAG: hypothetical protein FJX31_11220 [Alphaproteobacteria bacterium]|nr:hypothetical protein [Alphaproteobacteria bacterium]
MRVGMASLELIDHTQEMECWRLPQQQRGARQLAPARDPLPVRREPAETPARHIVELSAE